MNMLDYLDWRGDLSVKAAPLCEVDNLILAMLSFLDLRGIAEGKNIKESISLRDATAAYFAIPKSRVHGTGALIPKELPTLFEKAAASARFGGMRLFRFSEIIDKESETQFAALSISVGDGSTYISFRGTDDTLIGWKEDFNMGFMDEVPAQRCALEYLCGSARAVRGGLRVGGHSKGGNLALFSAAHAPKKLQSRLLAVYNNDGPGFGRPLTDTDGYKAISGRILTLLPHFSVVGLLLEHDKKGKVVVSTAEGLLQHDPFSWQVQGREFLPAPGLSVESRKLERTIKAWVADMEPDERRQMVEAIYQVFTAGRAETLTDIVSDKIEFIKSLRKLDPKVRDVIFATGRLFLRESVRTATEDLSAQIQQRKPQKRGGKK